MEPSHPGIDAGVDLEDKGLSDITTLSQGSTLNSGKNLFSRRFTLPYHSSRTPLVKPNAPTHGEPNRKGPLGLTLVHQPPQQTRPVAHLIFVHGLGGGSEHTWIHDGVLWPRDLLPEEDAFEATSIHTFGYDSDFKKSSTLNIQDVSKSLLSSTLNNPYISASQCPIILVGHSMGGLVMKRAYVLAKQLPIYQSFAQLVRAMVFLATPHTGSNLAAVLSKVFRMSSGLKPYLEDLTKNSETVQSINTEFPSHSSGLSLYSFYETKPMSIGGFGEGFQGNAPPRTAFDGSASEDQELLNDYLVISEPPADDLHRINMDRLPGTCEWLSNHETYVDWLHAPSAKIYWLRGPPGSGKSYSSGYVIESMEQMAHRCCFHFFDSSDKVRSSMEHFLLSMTWQMATIHNDVRRRILQACSKDPDIARTGDWRVFQRKFWEQGVFLSTLLTPTFWVIDALDECRSGQELKKFLIRVQEKSGGLIRILITTRNPYSDYQLSEKHLIARDIRIEDIQNDIASYLEANKHEVPGVSPQERRFLCEGILEKANGCFLSMSQREKQLSKTILTWAACAVRPLTTLELKFVLEHLAMDELDDIEAIISKYCHDLLYVDMSSLVRIRHASARKFLLRQDINCEFDTDLTISEEQGNKELAMACLEYLNGPEMKARPLRRVLPTLQKRSIFVSYACKALHEHINKSSALDRELLTELAAFLNTNVLSWIEYLAEHGDLDTILRFSQVLKVFLRRKSRTDLLLGEEVVIIDMWVADLIKLVSKFGRQMLKYPESIFQLIPPFCPPESAIFEQFARGTTSSIAVHGLSARLWDDRLSTLALSDPRPSKSGTIPRERLLSLASSEESFSIGTSEGRIVIFNVSTCLEERTVYHGQPVLSLLYGTTQPLLVSVSRKLVRVWNTETWVHQWQIPIRQNCMALAFVDDDQLLLAALKNSTLVALNLTDRTMTTSSWTENLDDPYQSWYHGVSVQFASFDTDLGLLAVAYSCRHLLVYNYEQDSYQIFDEKGGLTESPDQLSRISVYALTFSRLPDTSLLAVSYSISELVLFDIDTGKIVATTSAVYFSRLVSSSDGRTLAASSMDGAIELYDFETLHKLYRIGPDDGAVSALAFTTDSTRFLVIRAGGRNCRIWDPEALFRRDIGRNSVRSPSLGSGSQDGTCNQMEEASALITAIASDERSEIFLVGKDDFSVSAHDLKMGVVLAHMFSHVAPVKALEFRSFRTVQILVSADTAGFLMAHKITRSRSTKTWNADQLFTHRASVTGVQQFLCSKTLPYVLVCSNDRAIVLSVETGAKLAGPMDCRILTEGNYVFSCHPTNPEFLLCMTSKSAHVLEWSTLERISVVHGIHFGEINLDEIDIRESTAMLNGSSAVIANTYAPQGQGLRGRSTHFFFAADRLSIGTADVAPLAEYQMVAQFVDTLIGVYRDRLVFLHTDGWVCSIKAAELKVKGYGGIVHHFAAPIEWLRTSRDPIIRLSKLGDVLFAVRGEVAVIKRGLAEPFVLEPRP
ncbi:putative DUF676 domain-containing protein [Seiridium cardinale]|uniref:GPI inositol-deacylase n=1 Tax=Seiridium cardinale TaxID=138064 RepID=A0ABR2X719_9PEZI